MTDLKISHSTAVLGLEIGKPVGCKGVRCCSTPFDTYGSVKIVARNFTETECFNFRGGQNLKFIHCVILCALKLQFPPGIAVRNIPHEDQAMYLTMRDTSKLHPVLTPETVDSLQVFRIFRCNEDYKVNANGCEMSSFHRTSTTKILESARVIKY